MSDGEFYEKCNECGEDVRLVFRPAEDYTHAKLKCGCNSATMAFGNVSIRESTVPDSWGESNE